MRSMSLLCCILTVLVGCAVGPSREEIEESTAQEEALEAEKKAYYDKNSAQALEMLKMCQTFSTINDARALMKAIKPVIDGACQVHLTQMEIIAGVWDVAITRSVYLKDTSPSLEIAKYQLWRSERGFHLIDAACDQCIKQAMQQINSLNGRSMDGFDDLLNYYTTYTQIYDLLVTPKGSLMSYKQAINALRLETTKMSNKLSIILW